jgi:hypothetical protein
MKKLFVLTVLFGLGSVFAMTPNWLKRAAEWCNGANEAPSPGAEALAKSLKSGQGWRLAKHGDGLVNEKANVHIDLAKNNWSRCGIVNWRDRQEPIEWYDAKDRRYVAGEAKALKERLLLTHYDQGVASPKVEIKSRAVERPKPVVTAPLPEAYLDLLRERSDADEWIYPED